MQPWVSGNIWSWICQSSLISNRYHRSAGLIHVRPEMSSYRLGIFIFFIKLSFVDVIIILKKYNLLFSSLFLIQKFYKSQMTVFGGSSSHDQFLEFKSCLCPR